ncbi:MAG: ECF transporter S component, partial [Clostridia bacterium]|nr:ECF transporter S component [Clostridia bacterium]
MNKNTTLHLVLAAMFTALGILLPIVLSPVPAVGQVILPMHIPVLLCGFILGKEYGTLVGFIVPLLSTAFTGKPPLYPVAVSMALELAAYGFFAGLLYKEINLNKLISFIGAKKINLNVFVSLIGAMLAGRLVMGVANVVLLGIKGKSYAFSAFIAGAFVTAWPGIVIQLILIPII